MKLIMNVLCGLVVSYLVILLCLYIFQNKLIYFPDKTEAFDVREARVLTILTPDGQALTSFFALPRIGDEDNLIVMFHGNAGHAGHRVEKLKPYMDQGYGAVIAGYRGYGGNTGIPSEDSFYRDGDFLIETLIDKGYAPENMIIYGESLGTGTAAKIAKKYPVKGLILETPFTSLVDIGMDTYPIFPVRYLMKDRYDTLSIINEIRAPILFLHGTNDIVVPVKHTHALYQTFKGQKQVKIFEGGQHSNLNSLGSTKAIDNFIKSL